MKHIRNTYKTLTALALSTALFLVPQTSSAQDYNPQPKQENLVAKLTPENYSAPILPRMANRESPYETANYFQFAQEIPTTKYYFGHPNSNENVGFISRTDLIKSTPEYKEIKKEKIEEGTGKYWILLDKATNKVQKAINNYAQEHGFDFITDMPELKDNKPLFKKVPQGFENLSDQEIVNELDITWEIIDYLNEED